MSKPLIRSGHHNPDSVVSGVEMREAVRRRQGPAPALVKLRGTGTVSRPTGELSLVVPWMVET